MSVTEEKPRHQKAPAPPKSPGTSVTEARQQIYSRESLLSWGNTDRPTEILRTILVINYKCNNNHNYVAEIF